MINLLILKKEEKNLKEYVKNMPENSIKFFLQTIGEVWIKKFFMFFYFIFLRVCFFHFHLHLLLLVKD